MCNDSMCRFLVSQEISSIKDGRARMVVDALCRTWCKGLLVAVLCGISVSWAGSPEFKYEYHYGIIDSKGRVVLEPKYEIVDHFDNNSGLALVRVNRGKYGFVDRSGKFVIEPQYEIAGTFDKESGLAPVKLNGKWGFVDHTGEHVIEPKYDRVDSFNIAAGLVPVALYGKWGLVDHTGRYVLEPRYDQGIYIDKERGLFHVTLNGKFGFVDNKGKTVVEPLYEYCFSPITSLGLTGVKLNGKCGFINLTGKIAIEPIYDFVGTFNKESGLAEVRLNGKGVGLIDASGRIVVEPKYEYIRFYDPSSGLISVSQNGKAGFIDRTGKVVIELKYTKIYFNVTTNLARVELDGKWGLVDRKGEVVIEAQYEDIGHFDEVSGLASIKIGGKWGLIDRKGEVVIQAQYEDIGHFDEVSGLASIKFGGKWGLIDRAGKVVVEPKYEMLSGRFDRDSGLTHAKSNGKFGFINRTGEFVIEPVYEKLLSLGKGTNLILAEQRGKWGLIDPYKGKVLVDPIFEKAQRFEQFPGIARVSLNGKWGLIDRMGKVAVEPKYEDFGDFANETGLALVKLNGKWGMIDTLGREIVAPKYDYIGRLPDRYFQVGLGDTNSVEMGSASGAKPSRFYVGSDGQFRQGHPQVAACGFPDISFPTDFAVFAAGAYSGRKILFQIDHSGHEGTQIDVSVNSPTKPVVLILGAYEPTIWNISWSDKTNILAVLVSGYHRQVLAGLPKNSPILVSSHDNRGPCGSFYVAPNKLDPLNPLSRRVFGRPVDMVYFAQDGKVIIGDPVTAKTVLVTSRDVTPESFHDKSAPIAGTAGLIDAVNKGLLRKATAADAKAWSDAVLSNSPKRDIPSIAGQGLPKPPKLSLHRAYVVLKPFVFPAGLYGGNSATFLIPKGVSKPDGNPGHSTFYDFNTLTCVGVSCITR